MLDNFGIYYPLYHGHNIYIIVLISALDNRIHYKFLLRVITINTNNLYQLGGV